MSFNSDIYPTELGVEGQEYLQSRGLDCDLCYDLGVTSYMNFVYFPYFVNGKLWRAMFRNILSKQFMYTKPWFENGWVFWNQNNFENKEYLIITEGQFDCIAVLQIMGKNHNVVSLPNGANNIEKPFKDAFSYLQEYKTIYLCFDNDQAGKNAVEAVKKFIPCHKLKVIHLQYKDANELLLEEKENAFNVFYKAFLNAETFRDDQFDDGIEILKSLENPQNMGTKTGFAKLDQTLGGIRKGELTVLTADTGSGKTTFSIQLAKNLAEEGLGVSISSFEMGGSVLMRKLSSQILKKDLRFSAFYKDQIDFMIQWMKDKNVHLNNDRINVSIDQMINFFEKAKTIYGKDFFVVDHFEYIVNKGKCQTTLENINEAMPKLHEIALALQIHILLVVHPSKTPEAKIKMNHLKGSSSIKQYADNVLILDRASRKEHNENSTETVLYISKNRLASKEGSIKLNYSYETDSFSEIIEPPSIF